jgi:hypothetical protein
MLLLCCTVGHSYYHEITTATPTVGEDILPKNKGDGVGGQRTDVVARRPEDHT